MRSFTALSWSTLAGHGPVVSVDNPGNLPVPESLIGQSVKIDGDVYMVQSVGTVAIGRGSNNRYPAFLGFDLLVERA